MESNRVFTTRFKSARLSIHCITGQGILEFALLLPLLVLIVIGLIDLGLAFHALIAVTNTSREGARQGIFNYQEFNPTQQIRNATVREAATFGLTIDPNDVTITCNNSYSSTPPNCPRFEPLRVQVCYEFNFLLEFFFSQSITICRQTEMMVP